MLRIDTDFPGGNLKLFESTGDLINIAPDPRNSTASPYHWAFRIRGGHGRTLAFRFTSFSPVGPKGPAISTDHCHTWHWTNQAFEKDSFAITIPYGCEELYVAFAPLYTQETYYRFLGELPRSLYQSGFITVSNEGRPVELLHLGPKPDAAEKHVILTSRHHAPESPGSYLLEGIVSYIVFSPSPDAQFLREKVSVSIIPFVDKDGVEEGEDRNNSEDYGKQDFVHPETAAITKLVKTTISRHGKIDFLCDFRSPRFRGPSSETCCFIGNRHPSDALFRRKFGRTLRRILPFGATPYNPKDDLPFGIGWNTDDAFENGKSLTYWAGKLLGVKVCTSFAIPFAKANGTTVTDDGLRLLGGGFAQTLSQYLYKNNLI